MDTKAHPRTLLTRRYCPQKEKKSLPGARIAKDNRGFYSSTILGTSIHCKCKGEEKGKSRNGPYGIYVVENCMAHGEQDGCSSGSEQKGKDGCRHNGPPQDAYAAKGVTLSVPLGSKTKRRHQKSGPHPEILFPRKTSSTSGKATFKTAGTDLVERGEEEHGEKGN